MLSNAYLNAYNSIAPSVDLTETGGRGGGPGGRRIRQIVVAATAAGLTPVGTAAIAGGFLPDVMRIETNQSIAVGTAAYNASLSGTPPILNGGRKVTDDVVKHHVGLYLQLDAVGDIHTAIDDKISYYMDTTCSGAAFVAGANPAAPGHQCLNGQTSNFGAATFPFLAAAN